MSTQHKKQTRKIQQTIKGKPIMEMHTYNKRPTERGAKHKHALRACPWLTEYEKGQHKKKPETEEKGTNIRKRKTMRKTAYRKAKKKDKRNPGKCNEEKETGKENVNKTS